jgi:uncharacterized membrane protein
MGFCANCGAVLSEGSGFCGSCGKAVGTANQAAAPAAAGGGAASSATGLSTNVAGALAYVLGLITGILFLVIEPYKNDRFVRFHAMQSIFFTVACIVFSIAWSIVWGILLSISWAFFWVDMPLRMLISLGIFVFWLYLMYQAYQQREYRIPWIGDLAAKQVH